MGVLIPLYLAGLAALSLPVIFHLVRRTPRGRQIFSSLMFLSPTIPRLTRRSRIDQILLLLLRLAALALVAFAFSRPFLRESSLLSFGDLSGRRVAILIDTSASMRRSDLWQQAVAQAEQQLDGLNPQDDVALFAFSDRLRTIIEFAKDDAALVADKPQVARNRLRQLQPDWNSSDLGTALVTVAGELDAASDVRQSTFEPVIVVISDFQSGSRIDALRSFDWPKRVPVVTHRVVPGQTTNAFAQILPNEEGSELTDVRVRVVNAADSKSDQFTLSWASDSAPANRARETSVYVPAGRTTVVKLPRRIDDLAADRIVLKGDDQDFDNTFYVVPPLKQAATVVYVGTDKPDDSKGLQYFLRLAVANDPLRQVEVRSVDEKQQLFAPADPAPHLVVVSRKIPQDWQASLTGYVERGGHVLIVPANREALPSLFEFCADAELAPVTEAATPTEKYLLLGEIDFTHPLFAPFAGSRYSDFTKIHFWKSFQLRMKPDAKTRVVARFDNRDPALIERLVGKGRVLGLLSSWQPVDSQLALSSKFVPFIGAMLDLACGGADVAPSVAVQEPVTLPTSSGAALIVTDPQGKQHRLEAGKSIFTDTNQPGIYRANTSPNDTRFAVNLPPAESNTAPLDLDQLEQSGVRMGVEQTRDERVAQVRQQRDIELEGRQKIWRWLIVVAIAFLILETWWAGRADGKIRSAATGTVA